jgi:maltose-binding protein MalE
LLILLAICLFLSACKDKQEQRPQPAQQKIFWNPREKNVPALTIWTTLDPAEPMGAVVEQMITQHNRLNPKANASLYYLPESDFQRRLGNMDKEDLPPDLFLLPSPTILDLARQGLLIPVDDRLKAAEVEREKVYAAAWRALESEGRLWGIPISADMRLLYVNTDRTAAEKLTSATLDSLPRENPPWKEFFRGGAAECEDRFSRVSELADNATSITFHWRAFTKAGDRNISRDSLRVFAVCVSRKGQRPPETSYFLWRLAQSPDLARSVWRQGRAVPVLRDDPQTSASLEKVHIQGPWLDGF